MSRFRIGDRHVDIAGERIRLRLSISALAEIASGMEAESPRDLATRLRNATLADWNLILCSMATPRPDANLSKSELLELVPILGAVMSEGVASR